MQPGSFTGQASLVTPTRKRYFIMVLLFITVVINYLDRSNLSIAAPGADQRAGHRPGTCRADFLGVRLDLCRHADPRRLARGPGAPAYPLHRRPAVVVHRHGDARFRRQLHCAVRAAHGGRRPGSTAYPINSRVVTSWFPERERATAIGFYTSGQFVGLAFLTPVLAWLQHHYGWHMVFVVTGGVGILWAAIWYAWYREPRDFKGVNAAEIELIREGGGLVDLSAQAARQGALQLGRPGHCPEQAQVVGYLPGAVLPELHVVVLPDLVPDLPGEIPRHGLHQVRHARITALPRGLRRRVVFRGCFPTG